MSSQKLVNLTAVNIVTSNLVADTKVNFANNLLSITSQEKIGIRNTVPRYTLDVNGDINFTGNIYNNGSIVYTEPASSSLWTSNGSGFIYYNGGNVAVGTSTTSGYKFYVNGTGYFSSTLTLGNSLVVNTNISCNNINVSGTCTTLDLTASGNSQLATTNITDSLTVADGFNLTGDMNLTSGNLNALTSKITCDSLEVINQTNFTSPVIFQDNVYVNGKTTCYDDFYVDNKLSISKNTGNLNTKGSINVEGSVSIKGTLNVLNESVINKLTVNNDLGVNGNFNCLNGTSTFNNVDINNNLTVGNQLDVDTENFLIDPTINNVSINYSTTSTSPTTGALVVLGGVGIQDNLFVQGIINSSVGISTFQNAIISNTLVCNGAATFNNIVTTYNNLTVYSDIICDTGGSGTGNISCQSLDVGSGSFTSDSTGNIVTIGDLTMGGDLNVSGDIFVNGNFNLTNTSANFSGGIITNSRFIDGSVNPYNISNNYSGSTFIINSYSSNLVINLPLTIVPGTYFKIICGPSYSSSGTFTLQIISPTNIFGISDNSGTNTSIGSGITTINFNLNSSGDYVKISGVYIDSVNTGYNINTKSVNINGFTFS
jgi:hypothetical protein